MASISNLQFKNNVVKWATDGNAMSDLVNAVVENNAFTRSASDTIIVGAAQLSWPNNGYPLHIGDRIQRVMGRQLAINFGKNVVVQNNTFAVSDGVLKYNWSDGETIQNEAGGANPREDTGHGHGGRRLQRYRQLEMRGNVRLALLSKFDGGDRQRRWRGSMAPHHGQRRQQIHYRQTVRRHSSGRRSFHDLGPRLREC